MAQTRRSTAVSLFENRLASYSAMAIAAAAGAAPAQAGIVFWDPSDLTTSTGGNVTFNLQTGATGVGSTGMQFRLRKSVATVSSFTTGSGAFLDGIGVNHFFMGGAGLVFKLAGGVLVDNAGSFANGSGLLAFYGSALGTMGNWLPSSVGSTGFAGLMFTIGSDSFFGWALLTVNPNLTTTLQSFAYEACAGEGILTGATSGGASCAPGGGGAVPEPHTASLLALGAAGLLLLRRRQTS